MKKIFITLLIILFCIPLFAQELSLSKNNRKQQIENFFNTDTVYKKDTVYIILEYEYNNYDYFSYYDWYFNGFYVDYRFGFNYSYYNWYYNDFYWSYQYNWHNHYYYRYTYKPKSPRPIRQRTIATTVRPERKREYIRPQRITQSNNRYSRPVSKQQSNVRQRTSIYSKPVRTYNNTRTNVRSTSSRPSSSYTKPSRSTNRSYNTPTRSYNRSSTKSGMSNRSSSRGRR